MNIPEAAIRAAGHALRTRAGVDFDGWDGEAEIALRAALPHLAAIPTGPAARLAALQSDPGERARRIEQAAMLEAAQVPDDLVAVTCKIAARGKICTDDLVAIERAGIMLGIEVAYTRGRP